MNIKIGIIGATGIVGSEFISLLEQRKISVTDLCLFASEKSDGRKIHFNGKGIGVEKLEKSKLRDLDYLLFCSSEEISKEFIPVAAENNICCIDNSAAFRLHQDVPLVIPEINPRALENHKNIIANPNCSTIIALMALFPLHQRFGLSGFYVSTYQAVSGVGHSGIEALKQDIIGNFSLSQDVFGEQILQNAIPKVGQFSSNGYSSEELKMANESRKILSLQRLKVSSICVRLPILRAHSMSIIARFRNPFDLDEAERVLATNEHIDYFPGAFPTPLKQACKNNIGIGRLRKDTFLKNAATMWVVGDQIRKGAALNAIQIMEHLEHTRYQS
ncbi:MAG: aspartate-semialdehyde dehydrogenase [Puniceicoccales bacterium]|jgi:aspartate-semialdehyde dehydrogenase|nr:aspartate-semialdehyde dehydrogenase [Puniceicoccales bacterium]